VADLIHALIAHLYYDKGMQQQEIAAKLGLSKMMVSRTIQKAREDGVVQFKIELPFQINKSLCRQMEEQYDLRKAVVVKCDAHDRAAIAETLGQVCAFCLGTMIVNGSVLGLGLGATIGQLIRYLIPMKGTGIHVVQLIGGLMDVAYTNPFTIVQEACTKLNAEGTYITYPAIVLDSNQRDSILENTPGGKKMASMWEQCTTAIFGVGAIENDYLSPQLVTPEELKRLKENGIVGDILGHCVNSSGEFPSTDLSDRLVSIPLDLLNKVPERIAVGGGIEKAPTLKALLTAGIVTTVFIDENTARKIVGDESGSS
jgi:DNA-binding transcriptional regulator LsrR (DeoR family)